MSDITSIRELALFKVGGDTYGVDIDHIQEINKNLTFTRVYNAASYVKGVMNLRGQIVTVIDLRTKFNYAHRDLDAGNRVLIVKYNGESVGLLVDRMEDIVEVSGGNLERGRARRTGVNPEFFRGIYKMDDALVIVVDVEQVLHEAETGAAVN